MSTWRKWDWDWYSFEIGRPFFGSNSSEIRALRLRRHYRKMVTMNIRTTELL